MNFYVSGLEIVTYLSQEDLVSLTNEMLQLSTLPTNLSHLSTWAHINVTISVYRKFMKVWILWKYVGKNSNWFQLPSCNTKEIYFKKQTIYRFAQDSNRWFFLTTQVFITLSNQTTNQLIRLDSIISHCKCHLMNYGSLQKWGNVI